MIDKIYIVAPAYSASGGPELLHQLCAELRANGFAAFMVYVGRDNTDRCPQVAVYAKYDVPWANGIHDCEDDVIICPETGIDILYNFKYTKKILWWLSVDNMYRSIDDDLVDIGDKQERILLLQKYMYAYNDIINNAILHLVQSKYAYEHCINLGIDKGKIKYLGDYLRDGFIENAKKEKFFEKLNIVAYNPAKGMEFTRQLMELAPEIEWFPLRGLTPEEMSFVLMSAKIYLDFGNHPGMDRIPREAAISGCCIITGKKGSADFYEDVPILLEYKFDDNAANVYSIVVDKIQAIFKNYEFHRTNFDEYRKFIINQKEKFKKDVKYIFDQISNL